MSDVIDGNVCPLFFDRIYNLRKKNQMVFDFSPVTHVVRKKRKSSFTFSVFADEFTLYC